ETGRRESVMASRAPSVEKPFRPFSGYVMLVVELLMLLGAIALFIVAGELGRPRSVSYGSWERGNVALMAICVIVGIALSLATFVSLPGFFVTQPNVARVLVLFGNYRGTVRDAGFWWTNPFTSKTKLSLR